MAETSTVDAVVETKHTVRVPASVSRICLTAGAVFSLFLWGFWERGVYALGLNAALLLLLIASSALLSLAHFSQSNDTLTAWTKHWQWWIPIVLVIVSYALYENPFIKACHFLFLPAAIGVVCYTQLGIKATAIFRDPIQIFGMCVSAWCAPFTGFGQALRECIRQYTVLRATLFIQNYRPLYSVLKGLLILLPLALLVVIPLLASADMQFAAELEDVLKSISGFVEWLVNHSLLYRLISALLVATLALAACIMWNSPQKTVQTDTSMRDSITAAIVLGGLLALYLCFLFIQFDRLWLDVLPTSFKATELYVKRGFWQLVSLSAINLVLVFAYFQRTNTLTQYFLYAFVAASLLLLGSASHRMFLYTSYYGFSYEKFYASYAVVYCILIFALIAHGLIRSNAQLVLMRCVLLLLWMYALISVFPTEYFIVRANLTLSERPQARLQLSDLKELSIDALPVISANIHRLSAATPSEKSWEGCQQWIIESRNDASYRPWYEHTLSSLYTSTAL